VRAGDSRWVPVRRAMIEGGANGGGAQPEERQPECGSSKGLVAHGGRLSPGGHPSHALAAVRRRGVTRPTVVREQ
jgi:hypothetical protein